MKTTIRIERIIDTELYELHIDNKLYAKNLTFDEAIAVIAKVDVEPNCDNITKSG